MWPRILFFFPFLLRYANVIRIRFSRKNRFLEASTKLSHLHPIVQNLVLGVVHLPKGEAGKCGLYDQAATRPTPNSILWMVFSLCRGHRFYLSLLHDSKHYVISPFKMHALSSLINIYWTCTVSDIMEHAVVTMQVNTGKPLAILEITWSWGGIY